MILASDQPRHACADVIFRYYSKHICHPLSPNMANVTRSHSGESWIDSQKVRIMINVWTIKLNYEADIDTIDNVLGGLRLINIFRTLRCWHPDLDSLRMFFATLSSILGAVILISIVLPWFLIAICAVSVCYWLGAVFYRASARELKVGLPWYFPSFHFFWLPLSV